MSTITTNTFQELATGDSVGAKYVVHGTAKAWANLNGTGTIALRDSLNVSSVVDNAVGQYTLNFTAAMADANFSGSIMSGQSIGGLAFWLAQSSSTFRMTSSYASDLAGSVFFSDNPQVHTHILGDLA